MSTNNINIPNAQCSMKFIPCSSIHNTNTHTHTHTHTHTDTHHNDNAVERTFRMTCTQSHNESSLHKSQHAPLNVSPPKSAPMSNNTIFIYESGSWLPF